MKTTTAQHRPLHFAATVLVFVLGTLAVLLRPAGDTGSAADSGNPGRGSGGSVSALVETFDKHSLPFVESAPGAAKAEVVFESSEGLAARIEETFARLSSGQMDPEQAAGELAQLRAAMFAEDPEAAAQAIVAFLESGRDAATGLGFVVGAAGVMTETPTMRTALLDLLGQSSVTAAADYAAQIFADGRSADEWALALRNVAWSDIDGDRAGRLAARFDEMLSNEDWLSEPTAGFLEAFDVAVALGGAEQIANLASVLGVAEQTGVEGAAFIALDRLTVRDAATALELLRSHPELLSWSPEKRASLFARSDVTDPVQRRALEEYLARTDLEAAERRVFGELFPLRSYTDGHRLISASEDTSRIDVRANDLASLEAVDGWLAEGRFGPAGEVLESVQRRLRDLAEQIRGAAVGPEPAAGPEGAGSFWGGGLPSPETSAEPPAGNAQNS